MNKTINVVHIEDVADDSDLVQLTLERAGVHCDFTRVQTRNEMVDAIDQGDCDLILSDYTLPEFDGLQALEIAHEQKPEIPFIFVSGTLRESVAVESLRLGASDYVLKDRLWQLVPAVKHALNESNGRTQLGEMEDELRNTRKLASIATLSGGLVHDFRNLLQILKLNIALLPESASEPNQIVKLAEQLDKATDRGCNMMQEFMVFARKTEMHLTPVDLTAQIGETVRTIRPALPKNVRLRQDLVANLPKILGDAGQVDRMLVNLIRNAGDAMPDGGLVTITTDVVRFEQPPADAAGDAASPGRVPDDNYVRVLIADTGTGMDEATRARIFEPFFTTKKAGKGTGLGLPVVVSLMEAHEGFIDVQSTPGRGTSFSLFFRAAT